MTGHVRPEASVTMLRNTHLVEDDGEFVHESDVDIALRIFDDLCRLGDADAIRFEDSSINHGYLTFDQKDRRQATETVSSDDILRYAR